MVSSIRYLRIALLSAALLVAGVMLYLDFRVRDEFGQRRFALPARVYARPLELHVGLRVPQAAVEQELRSLGYRESAGANEPGWFVRGRGEIEIARKAYEQIAKDQSAKVDFREDVHWAQLQSIILERVKRGEIVPLDEIGATVGDHVTITREPIRGI